MDAEFEELVDKIVKDVFEWIERDPQRYFKHTPTYLSAGYTPLRKESTREGYCGTLRTKCTIGESKASFKCWDVDQNPMAFDDIKSIDWPNIAFACEAALNGLYFHSSFFGPMMEVTNVMIRADDQSCPFNNEHDNSDEQ